MELSTLQQLIAFSGFAGTGKDTAAEALIEHYGYQKMAFAGPLKKVCQIVFGLTDEEIAHRILKENQLSRWPFLSPRQIMQKVGTELFRDNFPGVWIEAFKREALKLDKVVVTDCRFPDEVNAVHELGGKVIRIDRPSNTAGTAHTQHASEALIMGLPVDLVIVNDTSTPEEFQAQVLDILHYEGVLAA